MEQKGFSLSKDLYPIITEDWKGHWIKRVAYIYIFFGIVYSMIMKYSRQCVDCDGQSHDYLQIVTKFIHSTGFDILEGGFM